MTPPERTAEVEDVVNRVSRWAAARDDIVGLLLVGSHARNAGRRDTTRYADRAWADELAIGELIRTRSWGPITEQRFATTSGLEVEIGLGRPDWASVDPVDPGTRRVVTDGARILHDPTGVMATPAARLAGPDAVGSLIAPAVPTPTGNFRSAVHVPLSSGVRVGHGSSWSRRRA